MTRGDDVAQRPGPTEPKWGRPVPPPWSAGQVSVAFQIPLSQHVKEGWCMWYPMPKVSATTKLGRSATLAGWPDKWPPEPKFRPKH
jgi:hypothetical protein